MLSLLVVVSLGSALGSSLSTSEALVFHYLGIIIPFPTPSQIVMRIERNVGRVK